MAVLLTEARASPAANCHDSNCDRCDFCVVCRTGFRCRTVAFFRAGHGVVDAAGSLPGGDDRHGRRAGVEDAARRGAFVADRFWRRDLPHHVRRQQALATVALDRATGKCAGRSRCRTIASSRITRPAVRQRRVAPATASGLQFLRQLRPLVLRPSGKLVWSLPMKPFQDEFGAPSSRCLSRNCCCSTKITTLDSFLLCLEAATGKTLWRAARGGFTRSYATPIVVDCAATRRAEGEEASDRRRGAAASGLRSRHRQATVDGRRLGADRQHHAGRGRRSARGQHLVARRRHPMPARRWNPGTSRSSSGTRTATSC